jgi:hypothetical protein
MFGCCMKRFIGFAGFFLSANFLAAEPVVVDDWLISIDDVACWISTHPIMRSSFAGNKQHDVGTYFNVAFQNGSPQPEFSISKKAIEKHNKKVDVTVGSRVYEFIADEDIVFSKRSDDRDILFQMLGGNSTSFQLNGSENLKPANFFISLEGFKNAYNYIAKECNFSYKSDVYRNMGKAYKLYNRIIL